MLQRTKIFLTITLIIFIIIIKLLTKKIQTKLSRDLNLF